MQMHSRIFPKEKGSALIPIGVWVSLTLNAVGLVFTTGVIYQRVVTLESKVEELSRHKEKTADLLGKIQEILARVDERLKVQK
jgi:hypothetical protein